MIAADGVSVLSLNASSGYGVPASQPLRLDLRYPLIEAFSPLRRTMRGAGIPCSELSILIQ